VAGLFAYVPNGVTVLKGNKVTQVAGHFAYAPLAWPCKKMDSQAVEDTSSQVFSGGVAVTLAFPLCMPGSSTVIFCLRWLPWLTMTFFTWWLSLCMSMYSVFYILHYVPV